MLIPQINLIKSTWYHNKKPFFVTIISTLVLLTFFGVYLSGILGGNLNWHMLPSVRFGPPQFLKNKGFNDLYMQKSDGGWDGQMYFYAASDLLDKRQTGSLMDVASYRYQRIGLALSSAIVSRLVRGTPYVSGKTYFFTNLAIILLATFVLATFLQKHKTSPYLALFWSCFVSTILCLSNGMPDVTADAYFIIAIVAYLSNNFTAYALSMALACLSREAFFLSAGVLFGLQLLGLISSKIRYRHSIVDFVKKYAAWKGAKALTLSLLPIITFMAWQIFLKLHFGVFPSQQAGAVIEPIPFHSLISNFLDAIHHHHQVMSPERSLYEAAMLTVFTVLMVMAAIGLIRLLFSEAKNFRYPLTIIDQRALAASIAAITVLYIFFGNIVMEHYTGYLKASGIFVIIIVLELALLYRAPHAKILTLVMLTICVVSSDGYLYIDRLREKFPQHYKYVTNYDDPEAFANNKMACIQPSKTSLKLTGIEETQQSPLIAALYRRSIYKVFYVEVNNKSATNIIPVSKPINHPVYISYQWLGDIDNGDNTDILHSVFQQPLPAGKTAVIPALIAYPRHYKGLKLNIALYQEGCGWLNQGPDGGGITLDMK